MTSKKILITGATGFIGKNLTATLLQKGYTNLYLYDRENTQQQLEEYCTDADFVFHLAGVNRPQTQEEFMQGNFGFSSTLLETLKKFTVCVSGTRPITEAIVTSGGVAVSDISPATMQSKKWDNLYFAGEMIDVDAYTGGFNLQIAYSTGMKAAESAVYKLWEQE